MAYMTANKIKWSFWKVDKKVTYLLSITSTNKTFIIENYHISQTLKNKQLFKKVRSSSKTEVTTGQAKKTNREHLSRELCSTIRTEQTDTRLHMAQVMLDDQVAVLEPLGPRARRVLHVQVFDLTGNRRFSLRHPEAESPHVRCRRQTGGRSAPFAAHITFFLKFLSLSFSFFRVVRR